MGQNACPLATGLDLSPYDLILTSLPHYVNKFREEGVTAEYFPIAFDERLLIRHKTNGPRQKELTFVGGLGGFHTKGTQILETLSAELPLEVWGYGGQQLPMESMLRKRWRGEAWAEDMYGLLASSKITLNRHIDIAENYANNMRLYEATGMGACLVTDSKANLPCLFEPDQEIVTYRSKAEAVSKIKQLIDQPKVAQEIAARGQARTMQKHTYKQRMRDLLHLLQKHCSSEGKQKLRATKPNKILIACTRKDIHRMPEKAKKALLKQHKNHIFYLLSDTPQATKDTRNMKRWLLSEENDEVQNTQHCLQAIDPAHIVILADQNTKEKKQRWIKYLEEYAKIKNITITKMQLDCQQTEKRGG